LPDVDDASILRKLDFVGFSCRDATIADAEIISEFGGASLCGKEWLMPLKFWFYWSGQ